MAGRKIRAMALEIVNRDWRTRVRVMSVDVISHIPLCYDWSAFIVHECMQHDIRKKQTLALCAFIMLCKSEGDSR